MPQTSDDKTQYLIPVSIPPFRVDMQPSQEAYVPSHSNFVVEFRPGVFSSYLKITRAFKAGEILAYLEETTKSPKAYTSVQCGPDDHIEVNSDFVYANHSCDPVVAFDLSSKDPSQWHVRALVDIEAGHPMTFFYPSTEWDMDQPFDCRCGSPSCLGKIQGAAYLSKDILAKQKYISPWIWDLVAARDAQKGIATAGSDNLHVEKMHCRSCGHGVAAGGGLDACGCKKTIIL